MIGAVLWGKKVVANDLPPRSDAMKTFLARYLPSVTCVLSGFDRLAFRGSLIPLIPQGGMYTFPQRSGGQWLGFKDFVRTTSQRLKEASLAEAREQDRPIRHLESS